MLKELNIKNLAIIEDVNIEFDAPYISLVGQTGAGKSLIVDSLSLLKGDKVDYTLLRDSEKRAVISALFKLDKDFIKANNLSEYVEGDEIILKRIILPDKSNKYYINDEIVSASIYKELVTHLIDIHSQGENSDILDEKKQINYLDLYGSDSISKIKNDFILSYEKYLSLQRKLKALHDDNKELDYDYLSYQIKEIEKYDLKENEIEDLNEEFSSLKNIETLINKYNSYQQYINFQDGDIFSLLSSLKRGLAYFNDTNLENESKQAIISLNDLLDSLDTLEQKYKSLNKDPYRIDQINERLFELKSLQRKYGKTTEEILDKYNEYKEKLNLLDNFESEVKKINTEIDSALKVCNQKALLLKEERTKAANKLSKDINSQLANLGLLKNGFKIEINDKELSSDGIDDVKFLVSLNVGLSFAPLKKVASGGESSRLMLALKTVLNKLNPYDLVVFDEIDTGISGQIASLVAKNIKSISSSSQIIVISHLPQVVASTDQGIYVSKEVKDNKTYASISNMDEDKFILEVAKMLSGNQVTNSAILQAKELIKEYK